MVRRIRAEKPSVRAILTTGYDPHQVRGQIGLQEHERFLAKPFTNAELLELVQESLRNRPTSKNATKRKTSGEG